VGDYLSILQNFLPAQFTLFVRIASKIYVAPFAATHAH